MAEAREVVEHTLSDKEVRLRMLRALEEYKKKYPGYRIETKWHRDAGGCDVSLRLSPMLSLQAVVTIEPKHLVFVVTYPDSLRFFSTDISKAVVVFRDEVKKYLGPTG